MLALAPTAAVGRDRLAATLWPDRGEEQAKASLRQELSSLRKALGPAADIVTGDTTCVRIDRAALDADVGTCADGEFLEGLDIRSEPFDDWRRSEAARRSADFAAARSGASSEGPSPDIFRNPSILIVGFVPASADPEDVTFATGLVVDLRTSLSLWRWFPVIGPEAIGWKNDQQGSLREMADTVNATYALSGAIRRAGARIRVSVGLTDAQSGHLVWAETFDGDLSDIFEVQEAISRGVVARVAPEIERAETARIARLRTADLSAWHLVAQTDELERTGGEGYGTPESNRDQVPLLEEALRLDPKFARAWARLARYHFRSAMQGWVTDRASSMERALDLSDRAVSADPLDWEGQAYRALILIFAKHSFEPGRFHAKEAVRLNPSAPLARHALGCALEWLGEPEEALHHLRVLFKLSPNYPNRAAVLGDITTCELLSGRLQAAADTARQLRAVAPHYCRGMQRVVVSLAHAGLMDEARAALSEVQAMLPDFDETYVRQTYPYARSTDLDMILEGLKRAGWRG